MFLQLLFSSSINSHLPSSPFQSLSSVLAPSSRFTLFPYLSTSVPPAVLVPFLHLPSLHPATNLPVARPSVHISFRLSLPSFSFLSSLLLLSIHGLPLLNPATGSPHSALHIAQP